MIKRILVALDPDSDTPVATRYAVRIARRYDARVTGLAVVDLGRIESGYKGGGIGSFYYAEKLKEKLTDETRKKAQELIAAFENALEKEGMEHAETVSEGVPFQRIVEDMKYHDLLVIGADPHFFYGRPEKETDTVARVVKKSVAPSLVVRDAFRPVEKVLIGYDGSDASASALHSFVGSAPFGRDVKAVVVTAYQKDDSEAQLLGRLSKEYLSSHGFDVETRAVKSDEPATVILEAVEDLGCDLVVVGAHSVSAIQRLAFGSTTERILKECSTPLFVDA